MSNMNNYSWSLSLNQGYLAHYGTKGMKWGERNYQNKDGSYTAAGLARYFGKKKGMSTAKKVAIGVGVTAAAAGVAYLAGTKNGRAIVKGLAQETTGKGSQWLRNTKNLQYKLSDNAWKKMNSAAKSQDLMDLARYNRKRNGTGKIKLKDASNVRENLSFWNDATDKAYSEFTKAGEAYRNAQKSNASLNDRIRAAGNLYNKTNDLNAHDLNLQTYLTGKDAGSIPLRFGMEANEDGIRWKAGR